MLLSLNLNNNPSWSTLSSFINRRINCGSNRSTHFYLVMGLWVWNRDWNSRLSHIEVQTIFMGPWCLCDKGSLFHIIISLPIPFYSEHSISALGSCGIKGDKRVTCWSGCLCRALSCWGQQVGFLPSRDDAFYNEEVKRIIMEINSWTAMACGLSQAELWIWRTVL